MEVEMNGGCLCWARASGREEERGLGGGEPRFNGVEDQEREVDNEAA